MDFFLIHQKKKWGKKKGLLWDFWCGIMNIHN
jgi:hypothetical protein